MQKEISISWNDQLDENDLSNLNHEDSILNIESEASNNMDGNRIDNVLQTPSRSERPSRQNSQRRVNQSHVISLIRVLPLSNPDKQQSCVFPMLLPHESQPSLWEDEDATIDQILASPQPVIVPNHNQNTSISDIYDEEGTISNRGIILVTPNAIGQQIRTHITLETARLLSQVAAHLETEDWLRSYQTFSAVEWFNPPHSPFLQQCIVTHIRPSNHHSLVLSLGMADISQLTEFFQLLFLHALSQDEQSNSNVCTYSMLQIKNEKTLVDLLLTKDTTAPKLRVFSPDQYGAVVQNLTQERVDSTTIDSIVKRGIQRYDSVGVIIATITLWENASDIERNQHTKCRYLQYVHFPSNGAAASKLDSKTAVNRDTIALRQSLSSLGNVLRHCLSSKSESISFRDGTLTKLLQRVLEPKTANILVVGTICSDTDSYHRTAHTLNYMHQLFRYSAPSSPFTSPLGVVLPTKSIQDIKVSTNLAHHPAFLQSYVSDPRQRLAELEKKLSRTEGNESDSPALKDDDKASPYAPTNYLDYDPHQLSFDSNHGIDNGLELSFLQEEENDFITRELDIYMMESPQYVDQTIDDHLDTSTLTLEAFLMEHSNSKNDQGIKLNPRELQNSNLVESAQKHLNTSLQKQNVSQKEVVSRSSNRDLESYSSGQMSDYEMKLNAPSETPYDFNDALIHNSSVTFHESMFNNSIFSSIDDNQQDDPIQSLSDRLLSSMQFSPQRSTNQEISSSSKKDILHQFELTEEIIETKAPDISVSGNQAKNDLKNRQHLLPKKEQSSSLPHVSQQTTDFDSNTLPEQKKSVKEQNSQIMENDSFRSHDNLKVKTQEMALLKQSRRPTTHRIDSTISLFSCETDEAGSPSVTTPGVPTSIAVDVGCESDHKNKRVEKHALDSIDTFALNHSELSEVHETRSSIAEKRDERFPRDLRIGHCIKELQDAIDELKKAGISTWQKKAQALYQLQEHYTSQEKLHQTTIQELNVAEDQIQTIEDEYNKKIESVIVGAERDRVRAMELEQELEMATRDSTSYEKVAEQAVSSIENLHKEMTRLKADLRRKELESERHLRDYSAVVEEKEKLVELLDATQNQNVGMDRNSELEAIIKELRLKIQTLLSENDRLMRERNEDKHQVSILKLESQKLSDLRNQLSTKDTEIQNLLQSNEALSANVLEHQKSLSQQDEKKRLEIETLTIKLQSLTIELKSTKQRLEDAANDQKRNRSAFEDEKASLREKLRQVESERDRLHKLRNTDLSEMETLKLESAIRADLEKRLSAATSEIDRLRVARSKVHDEIAGVRADSAVKLEEKDNLIQQLKLELHLAKIEINSGRRRLGEAEEETNHVRKEYEEEQKRLNLKLSSTIDELSILRNDLDESMKLQSRTTEESRDLRIALQSRDDEILRLQSEIDRIKNECIESSEMNKNLKVAILDFRNKARSQIKVILEKKRECDAMLESEKEKNTTLESEKNRLNESLRRLRQEQTIDSEGLGTFKEDITKALKEKSDALAKAALLQKQLKEMELKVDDLEHELELSHMKSNEELLRKAKEECRSLQSSNSQLLESIRVTTKERDQLVQEMESLRRHMEQLQQAKVSIERKAAALSTSLEQSQRSIEVLEHKLKLTEMRTNEEPLKKAREENHSHLKTIAELQMNLKRLQGERNAYIESGNAKTEELKVIQEANQDLENRLEKLERNKRELEGHVATLLAKLRISEHNTNELKQRLVIVSKSKEEQDRAQTEIRSELEATILQKNDLEVSYQEALQELEKVNAEIEVKERTNLEEEAQALRGQLTVVTQREEEQRRIRIHSENTIRALEQEVEALRQQKVAIQSSEGAAAAELQAVRERNEEASQLIVTLAHQAKSSAEQRDQVIRRLKERLIQVSEQKEAEISALRARLQDWERSLVRNDDF